MRLWLIVFVVFWVAPLRADELLQNTDFQQGLSNWAGDGQKVPISVSDPASSSAPPQARTGMMVRLKSNEWTLVTQQFTAGVGHIHVNAIYTVSSDLQFSTEEHDYENLPLSINVPFWHGFQTPVGMWVIMIGDFAARHQTTQPITPQSGNPSFPQTVLQEMNLTSTGNKTLYLAFPPGTGTITFQKFSLIPEATEF